MFAPTPVIRWLRILCALVALVFGLLAFAAGSVGGDPINFAASPHQYYRIVATASPYFWAWGLLGMLVGTVLLLFTLLRRHKEPQ